MHDGCGAGFREVNVDEKETLVGKVFSNVAPSYDIMNDVMSAGVHRYWKNRFVSMLHPFPGMQHLDVAGGTGDIAFRILNSMKAAGSGKIDGRVTVLDINASMVEEGRKKAAKLGLEGTRQSCLRAIEYLPQFTPCHSCYRSSSNVRQCVCRTTSGLGRRLCRNAAVC